jgi:hypothetical protein
MKVRALRMKDGYKEFAMFDEQGELFTSQVPHLLPTTATIKGLKKYHSSVYPEDHIDYHRLEMVEFELTELKVLK